MYQHAYVEHGIHIMYGCQPSREVELYIVLDRLQDVIRVHIWYDVLSNSSMQYTAIVPNKSARNSLSVHSVLPVGMCIPCGGIVSAT